MWNRHLRGSTGQTFKGSRIKVVVVVVGLFAYADKATDKLRRAELQFFMSL